MARNLATLETLGRLERFEGHLLNWYDIRKLEPFHPRYVSTVDSGNLLASLWTFEISCVNWPRGPCWTRAPSVGWPTRSRWCAKSLPRSMKRSARRRLLRLRGTDREPAGESGGNHRCVCARLDSPRRIYCSDFFHGRETDPRAYWAQQVAKQVEAWNGIIDKYLRPVEILMAPPAQLMSLGEDGA